MSYNVKAMSSRKRTRPAAVLADAGLKPAPTHIEVYLNNPGRVRPAALRTVLLRRLAA